MNTFPTNILPQTEILNKIANKLIISTRFLVSGTDKESIKNFFQDNAKEEFYYYLKSWLGRKLYGNNFYFRDNALINAIDDEGKCNIASTEENLTVYSLNPESSSITYTDVFLPVKATILANMEYSGDGDYLKIYNDNIEILVKIQDNLLVVSAKSQISDEVINKSLQLKTKQYLWTNQQYSYFCFAISYFENKIIVAHNNISLELVFKQNLDTASLNLDSYKNIYDLVISEYESDAVFLKSFQEMIGTGLSINIASGSVSLSKAADVYLQANHRINSIFSQETLQPQQRGTNFDIRIKLQEV